MVFSRFIWTILILVALITATSLVLGLYVQKPEFPFTRSLLGVAIAVEASSLVYYLVRIRSDLLRLIDALRNQDPTLKFPGNKKDPYFTPIHRGFNEIIKNFRLVKYEREAEHQFFEATVNHVSYGMIAFRTDGMVEWSNRAFRELFQTGAIYGIADLSNVQEDLPDILNGLVHQKESLKRVAISGDQKQLIFLASKFRLSGQEINLVSVRDLTRELDRNELEAWQKLIRILRHEILNSISPIKILSGSLAKRMDPESGDLPLESTPREEIEEIKTGLETIHRRATGLSNFLDAYSNLYQVPEPVMKEVNLKGVLERTGGLFREEFEQENIAFRILCNDPGLEAILDERMIEQVLINMVRNCIEALKEQQEKSIQFEASGNRKEQVISVKDTGPGIPEEQLEAIFIPFYSTRNRGSGIGLSFSQHVMRLHNGYIRVHSEVGTGSEFQLIFRKP